MRRFSAGEQVTKGYYVNPRAFEFLTIGKEGGALPGEPGTRYIRVPWMAMLMVAPILGVSFVFFLPALAFVGLAYYAALAMVKVARRAFGAVSPLAVSNFAPGEATLARRWKIGQDGAQTEVEAGAEPTDRLAELEREIAARRGEGVDGEQQ
ncbi:MAG TPA: hypothetical protein VGQ83_05190 [Polyangia bacterium]|jgi:ribosomal protein S16